MFSWRKPGQWYGEFQTYWGLLVLVPGVGAAMSAVAAFLQHQPWHLILFYASGVFCFLIVAFDRISVWLRDNTIFGKLSVAQFETVFGKGPSNQDAVNCYVGVRNMSRFDLYAITEVADLSLDGRTYPPGTLPLQKTIMVIPAGGTAKIGFATIEDVRPKVMGGQMKLKIAYGRKEAALTRGFEAIAEPQISVTTAEDGRVIGVMPSLRIHEMKFT